MGFEVDTFVTVIPVYYDQSKWPFITILVPFYLLTVPLSTKCFNFVNESLYLFESRLLIVLSKLHNSLIHYPTFPQQKPTEVSNLIERMQLVKIKGDLKLMLLILFLGHKLSISDRFDGHLDGSISWVTFI